MTPTETLPTSTKPPSGPILRWARRLLGSAAALVTAGVLLAEAFVWLMPQDFSDVESTYIRLAAIAFFVRVFQFHIAVCLLLIVVVAFAARWRRTGAIALAASACLLFPYLREYAPKHPPAAASPTVRVMAMNLFAQNRDSAAILRAIEAEDPDVIVMAEVTQWNWNNVFIAHLRDRYRYMEQRGVDGGAVVLSRLPCKVGEPVRLPNGKPARAPVVFDVGGREVALYGVHLVSPGHSWLVGHNRGQVEAFVDIAAAERRPMIIAGDCNFAQLTPNAFALRRAGLRTSQDLIGWGLGNTWGPLWWPELNRLPGVRIDHIFLSPQLTATMHHVGLNTGSDHRPVVADIALAAHD